MDHLEGKAELTLAWPFIEIELKRQIEVNSGTILREMSAPVEPNVEKIRDLAAERRVLIRMQGRFRSLCTPVKTA